MVCVSLIATSRYIMMIRSSAFRSQSFHSTSTIATAAFETTSAESVTKQEKQKKANETEVLGVRLLVGCENARSLFVFISRCILCHGLATMLVYEINY